MTLLLLALRSLLRNHRRTAITTVATALGVAVIVFGQGFARGVVDVMVHSAVQARTGAIQVHRQGYLKATEALPLALDLPDRGDLLDRVRATPGVREVSRRIAFGGLLNDGRRSAMVMVQGLDPQEEPRVCPDRSREVPAGQGSHVRPDRPRGAVVGGELARSFHGALGDTLTLTASTRDGAVNALEVDIVGITRGANLLESKRFLSVPLAHAQELLGMQGRVTEYAVALEDMERLDAVAADLRARLGPDYEVTTWEDVAPFFRDAVNRIRLILGAASFVLFVITVAGIVNTMLMSVHERVREIGTMLAVGWRRRRVLLLFLVEALVLGGAGGALGALLGAGVVLWTGAVGIALSPPGSMVLQVVRPRLDVPFIVLAASVAALGGVVAALYPARRASLLSPVEALRTL